MADSASAKPTEAGAPETKAPEAAPVADSSATSEPAAAATTTAEAPAAAEAPAPAATEAAPAAAPAAAEDKANETSAEAPKEAEPKPEAAAAPAASAPAEPATIAAVDETAAAPVEEKQAVDAAAPAAAAPAPTGSPNWPDPDASTPLGKLLAELPALLKEADYNEVYGLTIGGPNDFHTKLILQKFLRANADDLAKAKEQLLGTLKWRKEFQPLKAVDEVFSKEKFGGLGYVATLDAVPGEPEGKKTVVTFNLYGAVKDNKATFGDSDRYGSCDISCVQEKCCCLEPLVATEPLPAT
jgi:phosphatidylinositol transfer protein SFH5